MRKAKTIKTALRRLLGAGLLGLAPAGHALDVHLQDLPPAPGLTPSAPLDPLAGLRDALNCGLSALDTGKACGLSGLEAVASPFLVSFDPLYCRLTMRFGIGQTIDGLLGDWIGGALARVGSPAVGALCLLGIGPQFCGATARTAPVPGLASLRAPPRKSAAAPAAQPTPNAAPAPEPLTPPEMNDEPTGLDRLLR